MTDIVERLRERSQWIWSDTPQLETNKLAAEAADEIERLRKALEVIASGKFSGIVLTSCPPQDPAVNYARAALEGK